MMISKMLSNVVRKILCDLNIGVILVRIGVSSISV